MNSYPHTPAILEGACRSSPQEGSRWDDSNEWLRLQLRGRNEHEVGA
jgi:hypothetical protein